MAALKKEEIDFARTLVNENQPMRSATLSQIFPKVLSCLAPSKAEES